MGAFLSGALRRAFRAFAVAVLSVIARVKFGARTAKDSDLPDAQAVILCNHASVWDFAYLIRALRPRRVRFVVTSIEFEKNRAYAWMLRALGVIQKTQGAPDVACVRRMVKACRAGDVVALYPSGMTSLDGRPAWRAQPGTGKLIKLMGVSVYTAVVSGGFISHPRWAHASARGRAEIRVKRLFTAREIAACPPNDAQAAIERALAFNDWQWQARENVPFRRLDCLKGLTRLLYQCPNCGRLGEMRQDTRAIACAACGMTARRDARGFFRAEKGACPERMDEWVDLELDALRKDAQSPDFCLRAQVALLCPLPGGTGYAQTDEGTLSLTANELSFAGKAGIRSWSFSQFQYFVMNDVNFLHIYANDGAFRFVFADPRLIYRWFFFHRYLVKGEPPYAAP